MTDKPSDQTPVSEEKADASEASDAPAASVSVPAADSKADMAPVRRVVTARPHDTLTPITKGLRSGVGDLSASARILEDMASSRARLADLALGFNRPSIGQAYADLERTRSLLAGADHVGRQIAAATAGLELAGGVEGIMRRHRQQDDLLKAIGGWSSLQHRHSAMADTISAMGGLDSIRQTQERMSLALGVHGSSFATRSIADQVLSGASRQIERAIRDLAGVSAFTGLAKGIAADRSRYDAIVTAASTWRDTADRMSLQARLQAQLPDLFPQWRRAARSDFAGLELSRLGERFLSGTRRLGDIHDEMLGLRRPWVDPVHPARSVSAYIEARALTEVIASAPPQSRAVVAAVREELGDYRDTPAIPEMVSADPMLRSAFRIDAGFDIDFSSLPPALIARVFAPGSPIARGEDVDPEALEALVHRRVKQVERQLRHFILTTMTAAIGPKWAKQRVDEQTRTRWSKRRQVDIDNGRRPGGELDYAGFEDYLSIIDRNDNWEQIFKPIFVVRVSIVETLRRLSLIRNPDAHFRVVTMDDLIDLTSEAGRLDRWLQKPVQHR